MSPLAATFAAAAVVLPLAFLEAPVLAWAAVIAGLCLTLWLSEAKAECGAAIFWCRGSS